MKKKEAEALRWASYGIKDISRGEYKEAIRDLKWAVASLEEAIPRR